MWIRAKNDLTLITCRVYPNARQDALEEIRDEHLVVRLNSPPIEGRANKALIALLAKRLGLAKSRCTIVQGHKQRIKVVGVSGMTPEEVRKTLMA